uniref:Putative plant transposon protein domain-containing protein n=1 Tax=Solanum tuberosum TaxID=4113 RepID=M1DZG0_SOLTU
MDANAPGEYTNHLPRDFYAIYAATLMSIAVETETTKRAQKTLATTLDHLDTVTVRGKIVNISEETINRILQGPEYTTPASIGLFEGKYHVVTSESEMEDPSSREHIMHWIAGYIATEREAVAWVSEPHVPITKTSLTFQAKVWWSIVRAQLLPIANDNTLSPSLASLVAFRMAGYLVNAVWIIATEMRDRALNERACLPFPCLIGKLCLQANIPPNKLVDKPVKASKITATSKI